MLNLPVQLKNNVQVMSSVDLAKLYVGDMKDAHSDFMKKAKRFLEKMSEIFPRSQKTHMGVTEKYFYFQSVRLA